MLCVFDFRFFFFFKQKTAYEMRISDWSSDVCSSDLDHALQARRDVEAASRQPQVLDRLMAKARQEHSRAGPQTVSDDAEDRRKQWVTKRLVRSEERRVGKECVSV